MRKILLFLSLILVLGAFNWAVWQKQSLLKGGVVMYLPLMPVDPRAFLLGDYMSIVFAINRDVTVALHEANRKAQSANDVGSSAQGNAMQRLPLEGLAVVSLSPERIASFVRLDNGSPLASTEYHLFSS